MNSSRSHNWRCWPCIPLLVAMLADVAGGMAAEAPKKPVSFKIEPCADPTADADHVAIQAEGPANQLMSELIRAMQIRVTGAERISTADVGFHFACFPVAMIVRDLAEVSGFDSERSADGTFGIVDVNNGAQIRKLREEAARRMPRPRQPRGGCWKLPTKPAKQKMWSTIGRCSRIEGRPISDTRSARTPAQAQYACALHTSTSCTVNSRM
jgi:hypothetical protein